MLYPIGCFNPYKETRFILITNQTTLKEVGLRVDFLIGSINIDWGDGTSNSAIDNTEIFKNYSSSGIYTIEITGDFDNITYIGADFANITMVNIVGNLIFNQLRLQRNNIATIDLENISFNVSDCQLYLHSNPNLSSALNIHGSGQIYIGLFYSCNLSILDLSNVGIRTLFRAYLNPNLNNLIFNNTGLNGSITDFQVYGTSIANVDFSVFLNSDGVTIGVYNNNWTSTEHDNQLINLDITGWINGNLIITTGNAARTAASDTAYNNLIAKGWTIT